MSYKKGLTKTKYKHKMRMFWTEKWKYDRTPQEWADAICGKKVTVDPSTGMRVHHYTKTVRLDQKQANELIFDAIEKLILEKKLTKEHAESIRAMIRSTDPESVYVGVSIIAALKPKKFKRNVD